MRAHCPAPILTYGLDSPADVVARDVHLGVRGARFTLATPRGEALVASQLLGRFNVANWLAAATAAFELGATLDDVVEAAADLTAVPGRMERVDRGQPFLAVVDFAHTPQALENALRTLRPHTEGRLMVVFGHAGERDPASRPAMGRIAAELSDYTIISMDDPLHEDPMEIAGVIADGAVTAGAVRGRDFEIDIDRGSAIRSLVARAQPGDTILLAGKGHERRMLVKNERRPWNDRDETERALAEAGYGEAR
jgi:UDP-N-acetylmuramoyl-L-alanyl-D-glutamate--2,6-diaminopimelate ligase